MSVINFLKYAHLAYFSKPKEDRQIYRAIRKLRATRIVEVGIGDGARSVRMIDSALYHGAGKPVHYAGIDLFEARPSSDPGLMLKQAHRFLQRAGVQTRLIPGDPFSALARAANALADSDLLVVSGDQDPDSLKRAWFYVPRMLHSESRVYVQQPSSAGQPPAYRQLTLAEVHALSGHGDARSRAAA